ncbi:hypothetical protein [Allonocardiopsis opalescens]|uniref:t-SNARE coiled-coil homology domain-containing protein n=1 Tax=Allonocardiopsis opalescens TaxID=1144618 RepID=A0A2T0Q4Y0_9ACTN|nr:hypothetical protein [Allonocardiopsis opalescens]PRX98878.1 hypothetical protein CLV72_104458 [Allonocardiopsis opalescens]
MSTDVEARMDRVEQEGELLRTLVVEQQRVSTAMFEGLNRILAGQDRLADRMEKLDTKLDTSVNGLNERMDTLDTSVSGLNERMDTLDTSVSGLNERMDTLDTSVNGLNDRMEQLDHRTGALAYDLKEVHSKVSLQYMEAREQSDLIKSISSKLSAIEANQIDLGNRVAKVTK